MCNTAARLARHWLDQQSTPLGLAGLGLTLRTHTLADFVCLKAVVSVNPLHRKRECTL